MEIPPEAFVQDGRFSYQQARAFGITHHRLYRAVKRGVLVQSRHGVFALSEASAVVDGVARHRAVVREAQLASQRPWYAARRSAAHLMGLPIIGRPPEVAQLLRDRGDADAHGRDRHARVGSLPLAQRWEYDATAMTTPARAVIDIARAESFRNGVVVADGALRRGLPSSELDAVLRTMRRWPGVALATSVVRFADGRAESPGESITRVACLRHGLPVPEPQVEVYRWGVFVARLDLLVKEALLAIESDGAMKFTGPGVLPAALGRQEEIRDCGIDVLRTNWDETFSHTDAFGHRLRERLRDRGVRRLPPGVELRTTSVRPQAPLLGALDEAA